MIWFNKALTLADVEHIMPNTMADFLGMEWVAIGPDYLRLRMPVTDKTKQPYGLLHGGASCALAETIGSIGSALVVDQNVNMCVGLEINANHLRSATSGYVTATARPVHLGRSTHVWDIRLEDDQQKLVCISRLTVAILPKK
ncbi:MAG: hotdog fold thioesterase [Chitinophagaceae bacterium]|nr:MAG: hotdog fold thioesterase [Chitinophagaceae bacterium]